MKGLPSNVELSEALKCLNLPHSGTKQILLDRLGWAELTQYQDIFLANDSHENSNSWDLNFSTVGPTIKRIHKASRIQACKTLTEVLTDVTNKNDKSSWEKLFQYPRLCLSSTARGGKNKKSQATIINNRIDSYTKGTAEPEKQAAKVPTQFERPSHFKTFHGGCVRSNPHNFFM